MKLLHKLLFIFPFLSCNYSLIFGTKRLNIVDKNHIKTYVNSWIHIWKLYPTPLSDTRINECWKSIIWCTENRYKENCYSLFYKKNNYLLLLKENEVNKTLSLVGLIESPENIYDILQIQKINNELLILCKDLNYTIDYQPLRNWSHGYYFYEYR